MTLDEYKALTPEAQGRAIRDVLLNLRGLQCVSIHFESDTNDEGEETAEFNVFVETRNSRVTVNDSNLAHALISAYHQSSGKAYEEYQRNVRLRQDALAKLTKEERRALGLYP